MNKKDECILVKELLPIYCDDAVGEEGKELIEKHLQECEDCSTYKNELEQMKAEEEENQDNLETIKTEQATEVSKKLRRHKKKMDIISTAAIILIWIGFMCCFQVVEVSGTSMQPTYLNGERLLTNRIVYHMKSPERGDVVSVALEDMTLLKRVVGVPGDTIEIKNNAVYINGKAVKIKGQKGDIQANDLEYPLTLGKDEFFVMGDNVEVSMDSRSSSVGIINRDEIRTRIVCRFLHFKPKNSES